MKTTRKEFLFGASAGLLLGRHLWGQAESGAAPAENILYLRGCMNDRRWTSRSTWPDPHMSLFLDKLRALCAQLCDE